MGGPLFRSESDMLKPFLQRRRDVRQERIHGLCLASAPDKAQILLLQEDLRIYEEYLN